MLSAFIITLIMTESLENISLAVILHGFGGKCIHHASWIIHHVVRIYLKFNFKFIPDNVTYKRKF